MLPGGAVSTCWSARYRILFARPKIAGIYQHGYSRQYSLSSPIDSMTGVFEISPEEERHIATKWPSLADHIRLSHNERASRIASFSIRKDSRIDRSYSRSEFGWTLRKRKGKLFVAKAEVDGLKTEVAGWQLGLERLQWRSVSPIGAEKLASCSSTSSVPRGEFRCRQNSLIIFNHKLNK